MLAILIQKLKIPVMRYLSLLYLPQTDLDCQDPDRLRYPVPGAPTQLDKRKCQLQS